MSKFPLGPTLGPCFEELCPLPSALKGARHTKAFQAFFGCLRHPKVLSHYCKILPPFPTSRVLLGSNSSNQTSHVLTQPNPGIAPIVTHRCARALSAPCQHPIFAACIVHNVSRSCCLPSIPHLSPHAQVLGITPIPAPERRQHACLGAHACVLEASDMP